MPKGVNVEGVQFTLCLLTLHFLLLVLLVSDLRRHCQTPAHGVSLNVCWRVLIHEPWSVWVDRTTCAPESGRFNLKTLSLRVSVEERILGVSSGRRRHQLAWRQSGRGERACEPHHRDGKSCSVAPLRALRPAANCSTHRA